jgi:hypothetical protein
VISEVTEDFDGVLLYYSVSARSYEQWLDRKLVNNWYNQDSPESIIKQIISRYAPGFSTKTVQNSGTTVVPQYFDFRKVSEALDNITKQVNFMWFCDYYKQIFFGPTTYLNSPLPGNTLNVDTDVTNYGNLVMKESGDQLVTRVYVKGFKTRSKNWYMLSWLGDGNLVQWSTGYRISSLKGDAVVVVYPSMAAFQSDTSFRSGGSPTGGTVLTIKRDVIDGAPGQASASNTAYIHYADHLIRVPNFNGNGAIPSGYVLAVRFYYLQDTVFLGNDPVSQRNIAAVEGGDGIYEVAVVDKSLTASTMTAAKSKASLLLYKNGHAQIGGTFESYLDTTNSQGWRAGMNFNLVSTKRFGGINQTFYVTRVSKTIVKNDSGGWITHHQIEFNDTPYLN